MLSIVQSVLAAVLVFVVLSAHAYNGEYDTNFDSDSELEKSVWKDVGTQLHYVRRSGKSAISNTGPDHDHTLGANQLGKYLVLNVTGGRRGESAVLRGENLDLTGICSLEFYFNMNGYKMGTLDLLVARGLTKQKYGLFRRSRNKGNIWRKGILSFRGNYGKNIVIEFKAVRGRGDQSEIAIDDITFKCCKPEDCGGAAPTTMKPIVPTTEKPDDCVDSNNNCPYWARIGECPTNSWMRANCQKSCETCVKDDACPDGNANCPYWSGLGECEKNPIWMGKNCRKSCNKCP